MFYYPNQRVRESGACGLASCGGSFDEAGELAAEYDFDRTFGIVDTCTASGIEDEEVNSPFYYGVRLAQRTLRLDSW